jgi:anti-anti-sigma factor
MSERRIYLPDEVDLDSAPGLRDELSRRIAKDSSHLLVDCTRLEFIDSTGVAVLLEANAKLEQRGRRMLIVNVHGGPRRVFEALGLSDLLRYERETGEHPIWRLTE